MVNIVEPIVKKMLELGFYDLLVFIFVAAIFYGFLRKSKILGESPVLNGTLALSVAFLVLGYRFITGLELTPPLSIFFTQGTILLLFLVFGFLAASMFYPELTKWLIQVFTHRTTLTILIVLGFALLITSGLISVLWVKPPPKPGEIVFPLDIVIISAGLIIFMVLLIIAASVVRG